ncbi:MAG: hypothetical protein EBY79_06005 [Actinobacteria bacterium]|nr:hypothetical protein [Actinomycetota bacterium]
MPQEDLLSKYLLKELKIDLRVKKDPLLLPQVRHQKLGQCKEIRFSRHQQKHHQLHLQWA